MADLATVIARAASFFVPLPHGPTLPTKQHNIIITVAFLGLGWGVGEGGGVGRGGEGKGGGLLFKCCLRLCWCLKGSLKGGE